MRAWMVRAGNDNELADQFEPKGAVAIGWERMPDMTPYSEWDDIVAVLKQAWPEDSPKSIGISAGQVYRFRTEIAKGDLILSFRKASREYLVGVADAGYKYDPKLFGPKYPHVRKVAWRGRVARDALSVEARNSLGSTLTVFNASDYAAEIEAALKSPTPPAPPVSVAATVSPEVAQKRPYHVEVADNARALTADILDRLDGYEFQALVAAVLRAMGYKTREAPKGADGGIDVEASPDALLLSDPVIRVQVKHRNGSAGGRDLQQFETAIGAHGRGLFVSTGGFTKDAKLQAQKAARPITLVDDEQFVELLTRNYERLEPEFQRVVPLRNIWVPVQE